MNFLIELLLSYVTVLLKAFRLRFKFLFNNIFVFSILFIQIFIFSRSNDYDD